MKKLELFLLINDMKVTDEQRKWLKQHLCSEMSERVKDRERESKCDPF